MDQRTNYLSLMLLDALEDENEGDIYFVLDRNADVIDPGFVPQDRGIAPLHYVCGMSNEKLAIEITKRFLDMGADPNCKSEDGMTPLHVAAMYGKVEIVRLLLQHGAELEVYDDERKTPVLYAIEECQFEVVQIMRDHIFLNKYAKKKHTNSILMSESKFEYSLSRKSLNKLSTPVRSNAHRMELNASPPQCINKNLLKVAEIDEHHNTINGREDGDCGKYTPNRINYNYDITSPYYINITHRRHKPQPKFPEPEPTPQAEPDIPPVEVENSPEEILIPDEEEEEQNDILSISMQDIRETTPEPEEYDEAVNIFSLTKENLMELTQRTRTNEKSKVSIIQTWRDKVQKSRERNSILTNFDDILEAIDEIKNNYVKPEVKEKIGVTANNRVDNNAKVIENDSGACNTTSSSSSSDMEITQYRLLPQEQKSLNEKSSVKMSIKPSKTISFVEPKLETVHENSIEEPIVIAEVTSKTPSAQQDGNTDLDSSYKTVPEIKVFSPQAPKADEQNTSANFIHSPKNNEYFLQMAEAYVHTDDENGMVFYETRLLSNVGNKVANQRNLETPRTHHDGNTSMTSQSTNVTLPLDYETDTLRAELTIFGDPPGPITKTTKRLYLKRLMKYKRKTELVEEIKTRQKENEAKFSVELQRTTKSEEAFLRIQDFMKYETQSMQYFVNNQDKKRMREGHLKQSFIYMLIDPRISCNLPGESAFMQKFDVWQRFLQSIFYVGKGKTSRPYSHLYDAMKAHARLHNKDAPAEMCSKTGKKVSIKKQPLNVNMFKSPPEKSSDSKKLDRILNIWGNGYGVVCLHVFHNIVPTEAYTREAAIIDALSLQHLTNCKRGDYYGPAKSWSMKEKKYLGIALLFKAMHIYLAEGESQLSPGDLV
uniref:LEM domain-containing protein n=1 Tax=Musca domestica TaxID=7370 RepID=A0A1I8MXZ7_MUSDO